MSVMKTDPLTNHATNHVINHVEVLGYQVAPLTLAEAASWCLAAVHDPTPKLLVTLNPEIVVRAEHDPPLREALSHAALTVADGVGVVWAARRCGHALPERVPGVELMSELLAQGGSGLRVYFLGAKPGVAARAAEVAHTRYGTVVVGVQHGYFKRPEEVPAVLAAVADSGAQLLLAGLGKGQERFLFEHCQTLRTPLMMGVGGALDVLSGTVARTPAWTRRVGLEWAYRVGTDPRRWHRLPRLVRFARLVAAKARNSTR